MIKNTTRNAWDNQGHQNRRGCPEADRIAGIASRKKKNTGIETTDYEKSCARATNRQGISCGIKSGSRSIERVVTRDGSENRRG